MPFHTLASAFPSSWFALTIFSTWKPLTHSLRCQSSFTSQWSLPQLPQEVLPVSVEYSEYMPLNFCHWLAVWTWTNCLTLLSLSFLLCEVDNNTTEFNFIELLQRWILIMHNPSQIVKMLIIAIMMIIWHVSHKRSCVLRYNPRAYQHPKPKVTNNFLKEFIHSANIFKCDLCARHILCNIVTKIEVYSNLMGFIL